MLRLFLVLILTTVTVLGGETLKVDNLTFEEVPVKRKLENYKIGRVLDGDLRYIGLYGIIDNSGKLITEPNNMLISIKNNYIYLLDANYNEGILTKDGKWIGKMGEYNYKNKESKMYEELVDEKPLDLIIIYKKSGKGFLYGYLNFDGQVQIPMIYDNAEDFSEGFALVEYGGKWGYINTKGEKITEFKFIEGTPFENGEALVREGTKKYYIDNLGNKKVFKSYCSNIKNRVVNFVYNTKGKLTSLWRSNLKEK